MTQDDDDMAIDKIRDAQLFLKEAVDELIEDEYGADEIMAAQILLLVNFNHHTGSDRNDLFEALKDAYEYLYPAPVTQ